MANTGRIELVEWTTIVTGGAVWRLYLVTKDGWKTGKSNWWKLGVIPWECMEHPSEHGHDGFKHNNLLPSDCINKDIST